MRNTDTNLNFNLSDCISSESSLRVLVDMMAEMDLELLDITPAL